VRRAKTVIEIPMPEAPPHIDNPEEKAHFWHKLFFGYVWDIIKLGGSRPLTKAGNSSVHLSLLAITPIHHKGYVWLNA
jgi:hypothetical protein